MKSLQYFLMVPILFICSAVFAESQTTEALEVLHESYHRFESAYGYTRIEPRVGADKKTLQNFLFSGDFAVTPNISFLLKIPFVSLGSHLALTNPSLGLQGLIFEGLSNGFPSFVYLSGSVKPPLSSSKEFVFRRTDFLFQVAALREVSHLSLTSDLGYIVKLNQDVSTQRFGNELTASVGGEINSGDHFSCGVDFNFRHTGRMKSSQEKLDGLSLFIFKPHFSYHIDESMSVNGLFAMPLGRQRLSEAPRVFGDYTIPGVGGNTLLLAFEKKW